MSTSCVTAAPSRHLPGEAHSPPAAFPFVTRLAQVAAPSGYLGGAAAGESTTSKPLFKKLCRPCRLATTRQATLQLQPSQQLRPGVAQNALGDTRRHATQFARRPSVWACAPEGGANQLLDLDARVLKSKSPHCFSSQFHHKTSRNKGSNAPRPAGRGKTFGPLLWGPPGAHPNPKVQKES
jgi:hypothetical protein